MRGLGVATRTKDADNMLAIRNIRDEEKPRFDKLEGEYHYMGETH